MWSDPDVIGSRLDPQTADFAWRAAELWTQVAGLREVAGGRETKSEEGSRGEEESAPLAIALEHVRTSATNDYASSTRNRKADSGTW